MERIQERCLKLVLNDYTSNYAELLEKSKSVSMETKRLQNILIEVFKTLNDQNPIFMKEIFHYSPNITNKKHNIFVHFQNTTRFGSNSLRAVGAHLWNSFPENIKSTTSLFKFKEFIKTWPEPACKCNLGKN